MAQKSRSKSSQRWLDRQSADPFVEKAKQLGFRSRAAFKLLEIHTKDKLFQPGMTVLDLGAAPGGWSQVAAEKVGRSGKVIALDILPMDPIKGVDIIQGDLENPLVVEKLVSMLENKEIDLVISDMAPNLSGIPAVDQARAMYLAEKVLELAVILLGKEGALLIKIFQGSETEKFIFQLKQQFRQVIIRKPKASRTESREIYLLAKQKGMMS